MLEIVFTRKFCKDLKRLEKHGYKLNLLKEVIQTLANERPLDSKYKDHSLVGNYIGFRECHITSDWLLIYAIDKNELILTASRTGTHSDLF